MSNKIEPLPLIYLADDDRTIAVSIGILLKRAGYRFQAFHRPEDLLAGIRDQRPDLVLLDMNFTIETSGKRGLETLNEIKTLDQKIPVILMTGWATVQLAVEGMKRGAADFMAKPWDNKELLANIRTTLELHRPRTIGTSPNEPSADDPFGRIIGTSDALRDVLQLARRIAPTQANVLITGPSGTGKELLAEAIHYASERADKPFVRVNLGGVSESLFESELFGHKRGAFTDAVADRAGRFERAEGGTIFLDEIGDLPLASQVKLLRVLQEKTYEVLGDTRPRRADVRVVCATHRDLPQRVQQGLFREDLFYRINLITLRLPALAERPDDIELLAQNFLHGVAELYDRPLRLSNDALRWLRRRLYRGNVRELKNTVERTALMSAGNELTAGDFEQFTRPAGGGSTDRLPAVGEVSLEEMERRMIERALAFHQGNVSEAARALGLTRSSLYRRMEKFHLS